MRIFSNLFAFWGVALSSWSIFMPAVSGLLIGTEEYEGKSRLGVKESPRRKMTKSMKKSKKCGKKDSNAFAGGLLLQAALGLILDSDVSDIDMMCPRFQEDITYATQMLLLGQVGYEPFFNSISQLSGGDGESVPSPGLCTTSYLSHAEVKQRLADLPPLQNSGDVYRENELGLLRLGSSTFEWCSDPNDYDYCGIILGLTAEDHKIIRPLVDALFGDGVIPGSTSTFASTGNKWVNKADFVESAANFLEDKDTLMLGSDASVWTTIQLHKTALGVELSMESAEAFVQLQGAALLLSISPDELADVIAESLGTTVEVINSGKATFANIYREALLSGIGGDLIDTDDRIQLEKATYALLDSFLFAGGLSIPSVIQSGLAAYFTELTPKDFDMTDADELKLLVLESVRLYPPVLGVPYIDATTGQRHVPLAGFAGYDQSVYGCDASEFRIRGNLEYYHTRSLNWAESALPGDLPPHTNHVCPGRSLSFNMILGFLEAVDAAMWCVDPATEIIRENGPTFWSDFTLTRKVDGEECVEIQI